MWWGEVLFNCLFGVLNAPFIWIGISFPHPGKFSITAIFFSITTIFKMLSLALDLTLSYLLSVYLVFSKCPAYLDASWYLISLSLSLLDSSSSFTFSAGCVNLIFFDPSVRFYTVFFLNLKCYTLHIQDFK